MKLKCLLRFFSIVLLTSPPKGFLSFCSAKHNETVSPSHQCILCIKLVLLLLYWFYWSDLGCNNLCRVFFDWPWAALENLFFFLISFWKSNILYSFCQMKTMFISRCGSEKQSLWCGWRWKETQFLKCVLGARHADENNLFLLRFPRHHFKNICVHMDPLKTTENAVVHIPAYRWRLTFIKNGEEETEHVH